MMDLKHNLNVNIGLMLTPNVDLSLKILAMNVLEIEEKLKELSEENPIIKIEDDMGIQKRAIDDNRKIKEISESFKERFSNDESADILEATVADEETLMQSLSKQMKFEFDLSEKDEQIANFIIYNLDEKGFLDIDVEEIAKKFGVSNKRVDDVRKKIMELEPIGCGSLNTLEFLQFQAHFYGSFDSGLINRLIKELHFATKPNIKKIKEKTGIEDSLFEKIFDEISNFSLYPLENYAIFDNRIYIEPDVYIKKIGSRYVAVLNEKNLSRVNVDEELYKEFIKDSDAKEFLDEKYKQAKQFMIAIAHRNKTLLKTVNIILEKQRSFFEKGVLMPLTRKDIADELQFNVSTITRAVSNKYVEFEGKIIPLKKFFSFGVGENVSKDFVKNLIRGIVDKEDKSEPFNDDDIKELLAKQGINITRRTVTKYRKEMNIPNSRVRKCQTI